MSRLQQPEWEIYKEEVWWDELDFGSGSPDIEIRVLDSLGFDLGDLGGSLLPGSFRLLAEFSCRTEVLVSLLAASVGVGVELFPVSRAACIPHSPFSLSLKSVIKGWVLPRPWMSDFHLLLVSPVSYSAAQVISLALALIIQDNSLF